MMHVIKLDRVIGCQRPPVSPRPSDRDGGVVEVMDQVVRDAVVGRLPDPNPLRAVKQIAAVVDAAAGDFVGAGLLGRLVAYAGLTNLHAAGTEVGELTLNDAVALAAARQFQAVVAEVREPAVFEDAVAEPFAPDRARHPHRRLGEAADLGARLRADTGLVLAAVKTRRETPFRVRESEAAQRNALDELSGFGPPFEADYLREQRRNGLDSGKPLARARQVVERPGCCIQIPLARLVQEFKGAFRIVKITWRELEDGALAEANDLIRFVHPDDRQARLDPPSHRHDFSVGDGAQRF